MIALKSTTYRTNALGRQLFCGNQVARPGNLVAFGRMNTQHIPVRGSTPDEVKDMASTEIGAGSYLSLRSNGPVGRIQSETCRLTQPPNDASAQTLSASRFGGDASLGPLRLDHAWEAQ